MKVFSALKSLFIKNKQIEDKLSDLHPDSVKYQTTEPTEENLDGLKFVVLDHEPATKYNGYIYFITDSQNAGE